MDLRALEEGNRLLGNEPHAPAFEVTLFGGELQLPCDAWVCLSGAPAECELARGRPVFLKAGTRLKVGRVLEGARAYVCMGSKEPPGGETLAPFVAPKLSLRVLPGPQAERFDFEALLRAPWRLSPQSDRRGLRLEGPALQNRGEHEIEPEGNAPGAIQVPGSGQPIVLGPDRPVTGGYPKIATVLTDDLPHLAQARPGAEIRFRRA
jgi:allophanate hydrolase